MYYTVYKTTNNINSKFYVGKHISKSLNDRYLGSGRVFKKALKKYSKSNFQKEVLVICETKEEMNYLEKSLVTKDWLIRNKNKTYNMCPGGEGGNLDSIPWNKGKKGLQVAWN